MNTHRYAQLLAKNTWHCLEAQFDGVNSNVQIWADKTQIINAMHWMPAKANFWYDDVVVATSRVGCP